jgi:ATP-dependent DNA ligase
MSVQSERFVLDGEIVLADHDFGTLMGRLHPAASRVELLSVQAPASFVAFDLLALDGRDLREEPFRVRRAALEASVASGETLRVTEATTEPALARKWLAGQRPGVDGVIAKSQDLRYCEGRRAMLKVKLERTLECVVAGFRLLADRLLLGLFDEAGLLRHIGIAGSFSERLRRALLEELEPLLVGLEGHPWEHGFLLERSPVGRLKGAAGRWAPGEMALDWIPVAPTRVVEVGYDHLDGRRLRHPARFRRWRTDRDPRSCTFAQARV